jgi:hypothetical protein
VGGRPIDRGTRPAAGPGPAARVALALALLFAGMLPAAAAPPLRSPGWLIAEGGGSQGRGEAWRERREAFHEERMRRQREAFHEERMRRQREAWERRERMTPDERRALRRDLHDANRELYRP